MKNVCINFIGQPRNIDNAFKMYNKYLFNQKYSYTILYTTWKSENVDKFKNTFNTSYIRLVNIRNIDFFKKYDNYIVDPSNPNKTLYHCLLGLYIKYESGNTIKEYSKNNNISFDIIVTLRTDTQINDNITKYYDEILENQIMVASEYRFDIYNSGACPDTFSIGTFDTMLKTLNQVNDFSDCIINNTNYYHPETSFFKYLTYLKLKIIYLPLISIPCDEWKKMENGEYKRIY